MKLKMIAGGKNLACLQIADPKTFSEQNIDWSTRFLRMLLPQTVRTWNEGDLRSADLLAAEPLEGQQRYSVEFKYCEASPGPCVSTFQGLERCDCKNDQWGDQPQNLHVRHTPEISSHFPVWQTVSFWTLKSDKFSSTHSTLQHKRTKVSRRHVHIVGKFPGPKSSGSGDVLFLSQA